MSTDSERNLPILEVDGAEQTTVGNYFVSNYPPYSFWTPDQVEQVEARLATSPAVDTPLGLYVHIPFCRKRCDFCYFKVYTDKNSSQIRRYLDAVIAECRALASRPGVRDRTLDFIYFGGGTPSLLSRARIERLLRGLTEVFDWSDAREVTFECAPRSVTAAKLDPRPWIC